jgi:hypothetical protein
MPLIITLNCKRRREIMEKNRRFDVVSLLLMSFVLFSSFTLLTRNIAGPVAAQPGTMYWKPSFKDYALSGVPDFDQRQGGTYLWKDQFGAWSHCGPVAVANSLWWLDSEFEPHPVAPPTVNDGFPLVQSYGPWYQGLWDDHDPLNVPYLVEHLAFLMDTDGLRTGLMHSGTDVYDMQAGLTHYLSWTGVNPLGDANGDGMVDQTDYDLVNAAMGSTPWIGFWDLRADVWPASTTYPPWTDNVIDQNDLGLVVAHMGQTGLFYEHTMPQPNFYFIEEEVELCQDVVLLIDYYHYDTEWGWEKMYDSGHFVTVAGVDSNPLNLELAISDPTQDAYEDHTILQGRVPIPHAPSPPYMIHNNASLVSQDTYDVIQISNMIPFPPCPGGDWALLNYAGLIPPYFAVMTSAVITSPSATRDVAVTDMKTCRDFGDPYPIVGQYCLMHVNVTVENQGDYTETFWVTVYASNVTGSYAINQTQLVLPNATSALWAFQWDATLPYGNYTLSAVADTVCGEIDTADNTFVGTKIFVGIPGDLNGDFIVYPEDLNTLLVSYGTPFNPDRPYNPNCDLDDDHWIFAPDLNWLLTNYGASWP